MIRIALLILALTVAAPSFGVQWLKQSTATTIKLGPFVDSSDGVTAETGLTISQADVRLSKNGGNYAQKNESSAATHDELGDYEVDLDATDTNTLGRLRVMVQESGAAPVWQDFMVVPANTYDSLIAGSDTLAADTTQWNGTNVATPTTAGVPEVDVTFIEGTAASTELADENDIADAVWDEAASGHTTAGSFGAQAGTDIDAILTDTSTALPGATAGSSGGLLIAGTNAATTFGSGLTISNSSGTAFTINSSGGNGHGISIAGNGTGEGITVVGGATGNGIDLNGGGTSGHGLYVNTQDGDAFQLNAQGSGHSGLVLVGSSTGKGLDATGDIGIEVNGTTSDFLLSNATNTNLGTAVDNILDDTGTSGVALGDNSITAAVVADDALDAAAFASDVSFGTSDPNILYVNKSGDDGNDGSTPTNAYLTIGAANTAAAALVSAGSEGVVIYIGPGTYTETLTIATDGLSLVGNSPADTIIQASSGTPPITISSGTAGIVLRRLYVNSTGSAQGIQHLTTTGDCSLWVDECKVDGGLDAIAYSSLDGDGMSSLKITDSWLSASYDALATAGCRVVELKGTTFYTDSTDTTDTHAVKITSATASTHCTAHVINCNAYAARGAEYDGRSGDTMRAVSIGGPGQVDCLWEGGSILAIATSATDTGNVYAVSCNDNSSGAYGTSITLEGVNVKTSMAGAGTNYSAQSGGSSSPIKFVGGIVDTAAFTGTVQYLDSDSAAILVDTGTTLPATLSGLDSGSVRSTTVASVTSQTQLVLTAGPDFDDALNNQVIVLTDATNNDYESVRVITDYVGSTKTATLNAAADFTVAAADGVKVYATSPRLDASISAVESTTQPRINYAPTVKLKLASRNDGVYVCNKPVRLIPGTFDVEKTIGIDCTPVFGSKVQVATVGTCTVSGGSITATGLGPRDEYAMIQLDGTATASESRTVDVELTMDNGDKIIARFEIEVAGS